MCVSLAFSKLVVRFVYGFHMPLFFMMSGYVHGLKEHFSSGQSFSYYLRKNIVCIYIPCLFFSYLQAFLNFIVFSSYTNLSGVHIPSLYHFLTIPFRGFLNYWFLSALFFVKTLHLLLERYISREYILMLFWVISFIVIKSLSGILPAFFIFFTYGLYFHIGFMMRRYNFLPQKCYWGIILLIIGIACFTLKFFCGTENIFVVTGVSMCISLALFILFYSLKINNSFLILCGLYSMVIYCVHNYAAVIFRLAYKFLNLHSFNLYPSFLFLICFMFALFIPLMVVWLYKNVKCLRWIEYIFYPGKYKKNPLP